jgi:hypothetical protein
MDFFVLMNIHPPLPPLTNSPPLHILKLNLPSSPSPPYPCKNGEEVKEDRKEGGWMVVTDVDGGCKGGSFLTRCVIQ